MLSRFDICMAQLETASAKTPAPSQTAGDQSGDDDDQPNAKPVDTDEPLTKKNPTRHRDKKAA